MLKGIFVYILANDGLYYQKSLLVNDSGLCGKKFGAASVATGYFCCNFNMLIDLC